MAQKVLAQGLPRTLLNVNVPNLAVRDLTGTEITRLGKRVYHQMTVERVDPRGKKYYWIGGGEPEWEHDPGTDFDAIDRGMVSITPLHLDMMDYKAFDVLKPLENIVYQSLPLHGDEK